MRIHFSATQPILAGDIIELVITHHYTPTLTIHIKVPEDWVVLPGAKPALSLKEASFG